MKLKDFELTPAMAKNLWAAHVSAVGARLKAGGNGLVFQFLQNRKVRQVRVHEMALAMPKWLDDGTPLRIAKDGAILDGQHRILAIIQSGQTIRVTIAYDCEDDIAKTIDTNVPRSNADRMFMSGHKNATAFAATVAWLWRLKDVKRITNWSDFPREQLFPLVGANPGLGEAVARGHALFVSSVGSASMLTAIWYVARKLEGADAESFFTQLASGEGLVSRNPIYVLRERMIKDRRSIQKTPTREIYGWVIRAWNAGRQGRQISSLKTRAVGGRPITTPQMV